MSVEELLAEVEARGAVVVLDHDGLLLRPRSRVTPELIDALRVCKEELRLLIEWRGWPEASRQAVRKFGAPHARLYPFLNQTIMTPDGPGTLVQVFSERAAVVFDGAQSARLRFFLPSELTPPEPGYLSLIDAPLEH